ncbi:MAG: bifunctional diguanylate cyclase/phosphodiesterase [Alicyclobacillus macrosporangiidus]|uniref:putative bifunctional diguanylate cyclase/phosphodiesterase n=1 Tax=Alicyclobacillus macrosporangiidus TaxID=392015 RepID=UPI0026F01F2A|nr:bifunctional diguanylate cyclase/phosphodiesterase [Alicyclobacillus macrosporangiidus]MCL6598891.1 bifunctional diguanylate cyclase/phosphodiesterase [Alicyclobacillus macrosporangiidus]
MNRPIVHVGATWKPAGAVNWVPRRALLEVMEDRVSQTIQRGRHAVTLCLDLDQFRIVNYTHGLAAGDQVILTVAERLSRCIGEHGVGAHMGGDEFALCLVDCDTAEETAEWAERVLAAVETPIRVAGREVRLTASIGIASTMECGPAAQRLLRHAAVALNETKEGGRNPFRLHTPQASRRFADHALLVHDFERALAEREFFLEFQPRVHAETGIITSAEALLRWRHPQRGLVTPREFIPIAERTGWIVPIGRWVVEEVCRQIREWLNSGQPVVRIAVNVSARQFRRESFVVHVTEALKAHRVDPRLLEIELTETAVVEDVESARKKLGRLRGMGITVSIDDFGVGYSSLSFLHQIPVDALKLDRSFIQEGGVRGWSVMETIIDLGHRLNLCVVGEGVETEHQLDLLRARRCDEVQGFFFSRPVPAADFMRLLAATPVHPVKGGAMVGTPNPGV